MRGKDDRPCAYDHTDRITPAYAGKSGWFQRRLQHGGGSPPRMRGKDLVKFCLCPRFGITPAYAGKSPRTPLAASHARDHPRVCGEEAYSKVIAGSLWGSPPRMRGRARGIDARKRPDWITPAYAGKRPMFSGPLQATGDHPRVCGEEERVNRCACWTEGSPPRMRGRAGGGNSVHGLFRITPACAGKSCFHLLFVESWEDHPRVCGEKAESSDTIISYTGSPPCVRGKVKDSGAAKTP